MDPKRAEKLVKGWEYLVFVVEHQLPPHKIHPSTLNAYLRHSKYCRTKVTAIDKHMHGSLTRTLHTNYVPSLQDTRYNNTLN